MRPVLLHRLAAAGATTAALAAPPTAFAADAVYGGSSSRGGDAIVLNADAKAATLRSLVISWRAGCDDGGGFPGGGVLTAADATPGFSPRDDDLLMSRNSKGAFKGTQLSSADSGAGAAAIAVTVEGRLKRGRASGTLKADVTIIDKASGVPVAHCRASQSWSASRIPGVVYGGSTSQGQPVVLRLANRKKVSDVLLTWLAPCSPGGLFRGPDHLINFAVKSTGAFGNPFTDGQGLDGGGKRDYAYDFRGKLTKRAAKGTLNVKVVETDAAGAASTCDTGRISWKAATG